MKKIYALFFVSVSLLLQVVSSCVPARQYEEAKDSRRRCEEEQNAVKGENQTLNSKIAEQAQEIADFKKQVKELVADTAINGRQLTTLTRNYYKLNETYDMLMKKNDEMLTTNRTETTRLVGYYDMTQEQLQKKQDELNAIKRELDNRKVNLDKLSEQLQKDELEIKKDEARIKELQDILARKDSAVAALKKKVLDALTGFINNGLTVEQKNGKVYVSLEERLLFASGSVNVDPKGVEPLKKLAKVLEQNLDINVVIEGHTDNVPYSAKPGSNIKDNWDLSSLRATSVVKIIVSNSTVNPLRLSAAGRGEFLPIDPSNTVEARKKNRRTEIILTPKLDELLKVLETN